MSAPGAPRAVIVVAAHGSLAADLRDAVAQPGRLLGRCGPRLYLYCERAGQRFLFDASILDLRCIAGLRRYWRGRESGRGKDQANNRNDAAHFHLLIAPLLILLQ